MPYFDWSGTVTGRQDPIASRLPTLGAIGDRFGQWQDVPGMPGVSMPAPGTVLPLGWERAIAAGAAPQAPGAVGYIPPDMVPQGAATNPADLGPPAPASPNWGTMLARGLANFDFQPARLQAATPFAFTGKPTTLATLGSGQRGIQALMRRPAASAYA